MTRWGVDLEAQRWQANALAHFYPCEPTDIGKELPPVVVGEGGEYMCPNLFPGALRIDSMAKGDLLIQDFRSQSFWWLSIATEEEKMCATMSPEHRHQTWRVRRPGKGERTAKELAAIALGETRDRGADSIVIQPHEIYGWIATPTGDVKLLDANSRRIDDIISRLQAQYDLTMP